MINDIVTELIILSLIVAITIVGVFLVRMLFMTNKEKEKEP